MTWLLISPHLPFLRYQKHHPHHPLAAFFLPLGLRDQRAGPAAVLGKQGAAGAVSPGAAGGRAQGELGSTLGGRGEEHAGWMVDRLMCLEKGNW